MKITIFTDGGITGDNKEDQPCYCAYVADWNGRHISSRSRVDKGTSNQAEYRGLLLAVEDLDTILNESVGIEEIEFKSDSKIMINQVNNIYKTKDSKLALLRSEVIVSLGAININPNVKVTFTHVKRELNPITDLLCNLAKKNIIKTNSKQTLSEFKQQHNLTKYKALKDL